jgi:hypothetical protein
MEAHESLEARLEAAGEHAEAWRPEPGDRLVGEIVAISQGRSSYDARAYPILTVRSADAGEDLAVHAFQTVLLDELARERPKVGEVIGIKYLGEVVGARSTYRKYTVVIDRPDGEVWDNFGAPEPDPEPEGPVEATDGRRGPGAPLERGADVAGDDIPF